MPPQVLVSYDGTDNDIDALALGRVFAEAGATLGLAYVRHNRESEDRREELAETEAEDLLAGGARRLQMPDVPRHVVVSGSTATGLLSLTSDHGYDVIVFGSAYRTAPGHVQPGSSAEQLLEGHPPLAVAIAPAGLRVHSELTVSAVAYVNGEGDPSAGETAASLAEKLGAAVFDRAVRTPELLVIGSRAGAAPGHVDLSGAARYLLETVRCPVTIVGREAPLAF
jgi:nucleotide-binding universal stress UspA family protein